MTHNLELLFKSVFDFTVSLLVIVILFPIFLLVGIIIKIDSPGPVIFKQARLGKDGKIFNIYKYRTMVVDAERIGDGLRVKSNSDNRITRIGRLLRTTSLDELPQIFNILKGEMSFVGPRPPVTYHPYKYSDYPESFLKRFHMKPGITGLAQVKVRNSVPWDQRILYDIEYVENFSFFLDLKILLSTIFGIFKSDNLYKTDL